MSQPLKIVFSHGKESGPEGKKIQALMHIAQSRNIPSVSLDYRFSQDPEKRIEYLLQYASTCSDNLVLVGSSMGGYVSIQVSALRQVRALFLMAPAVYLPGYAGDPALKVDPMVVVHGLRDDIVPVENAVRFALKHKSELFLVDAEHPLRDQIPFLCTLFERFLDKVQEKS